MMLQNFEQHMFLDFLALLSSDEQYVHAMNSCKETI